MASLKKRKLLPILIVGGLTAAGFYLHSVLVSSHVEQCAAFNSSQYDSQAKCTAGTYRSSNTTWFGWLTGHSRSVQFHFVDLLELLLEHGAPAQPSQEPTSALH